MARTAAQPPPQPLHLVIIGGGVAGCAAAATAAAAPSDVQITLVNGGLPLGGACINTGCVAVHWLRQAARHVHKRHHHGLAGIASASEVVDYTALIAQKDAVIADVQRKDYEYFRTLDRVEVIDGFARLIAPDQVVVADRTLKADRIILATGSSYAAPAIDGIDTVDFLTGESLLTLDHLPPSLLFLGASEMGLAIAQIFRRFGVEVTVLEAGEGLFDEELGKDTVHQLLGYLREEGLTIHTGVSWGAVRRHGDGVEIEAVVKGERRQWRASRLVLTAERRPATRGLGLEELLIERIPTGFIKVDETQQTNVPGIYAAGELAGHTLQAHRATHEGRLAAHNAVSSSSVAGHDPSIPFVIHTDPQVAGVGWEQAQARSLGFDAETRKIALADIAGARATGAPQGFVKLVRDRRSDRLIGARIVAPHAAEMIMEAVIALRSGMTTAELANLSHPFMSVSETIKHTAQAFQTPRP